MKNLFLVLGLFCSLAAAAQSKKVKIETDYGPITVMLYDNTPLHRDNMLKLAKEKFYDSLLFHRIIPGFVIQGGDPTSKRAAAGAALGEGERKGEGRIPAEIRDEYFHKRGALAMARDNNPEKASSNCQFYIVVGKKLTEDQLDNAQKRAGRKIPAEHRVVYKNAGGVPHLDGAYTVFGEVVDGMEVVDKIAAEPRDAMDRPNKDVRMKKVRVVKKKFLGIF